MLKVIFIGVIICQFSKFGQSLKVNKSSTSLPTVLQSMPIVYDGEDSIFVFGGYGPNGYSETILKFSISTEVIQEFGTTDPFTVVLGSAVWAGNDRIIYFGGFGRAPLQYFDKIWSFNTKAGGNWTQVGRLPARLGYTSSVWSHGEYTYTFGGFLSDNTSGPARYISSFSTVTNISKVVANMPEDRIGTSSIWDESTGEAYIFGGSIGPQNSSDEILKFNPLEATVTKLNSTLPLGTAYSCAIWTGQDAYIIGGVFSFGLAEFHNITRFTPSTNEAVNVPVQNFPSKLVYHGCAFVNKLNRIYIFGGLNQSEGKTRDAIIYIDLDSSGNTTPTLTTLSMPTTGKPGCRDEFCCKNS